LWLSAMAYYIMVRALMTIHAKDSVLAAAIGKDLKGLRSLYIYTAAIPLAFLAPWIAISLYVTVAIMWFIPDRRIEKVAGH
jgi:hypothetical protein